jgi:hypothetical protein
LLNLRIPHDAKQALGERASNIDDLVQKYLED